MRPQQDAAILTELGSRLREWRLHCGIVPTSTLPPEMGVSWQTLNRYERGEGDLSVCTLIRLATALGTTASTLLEGIN